MGRELRLDDLGSMTDGRRGHSATLLPDGTVLVAGGFVGSDYTTDSGHRCSGPSAPCSAELYQPSSGRWTLTASPAETRGFTATLLFDGRVLATGDYSDSSRSAELYDPGVGI